MSTLTAGLEFGFATDSLGADMQFACDVYASLPASHLGAIIQGANPEHLSDAIKLGLIRATGMDFHGYDQGERFPADATQSLQMCSCLVSTLRALGDAAGSPDPTPGPYETQQALAATCHALAGFASMDAPFVRIVSCFSEAGKPRGQFGIAAGLAGGAFLYHQSQLAISVLRTLRTRLRLNPAELEQRHQELQVRVNCCTSVIAAILDAFAPPPGQRAPDPAIFLIALVKTVYKVAALTSAQCAIFVGLPAETVAAGFCDVFANYVRELDPAAMPALQLQSQAAVAAAALTQVAASAAAPEPALAAALPTPRMFEQSGNIVMEFPTPPFTAVQDDSSQGVEVDMGHLDHMYLPSDLMAAMDGSSSGTELSALLEQLPGQQLLSGGCAAPESLAQLPGRRLPAAALLPASSTHSAGQLRSLASAPGAMMLAPSPALLQCGSVAGCAAGLDLAALDIGGTTACGWGSAAGGAGGGGSALGVGGPSVSRFVPSQGRSNAPSATAAGAVSRELGAGHLAAGTGTAPAVQGTLMQHVGQGASLAGSCAPAAAPHPLQQLFAASGCAEAAAAGKVDEQLARSAVSLVAAPASEMHADAQRHLQAIEQATRVPLPAFNRSACHPAMEPSIDQVMPLLRALRLQQMLPQGMQQLFANPGPGINLAAAGGRAWGQGQAVDAQQGLGVQQQAGLRATNEHSGGSSGGLAVPDACIPARQMFSPAMASPMQGSPAMQPAASGAKRKNPEAPSSTERTPFSGSRRRTLVAGEEQHTGERASRQRTPTSQLRSMPALAGGILETYAQKPVTWSEVRFQTC